MVHWRLPQRTTAGDVLGRRFYRRQGLHEEHIRSGVFLAVYGFTASSRSADKARSIRQCHTAPSRQTSSQRTTWFVLADCLRSSCGNGSYTDHFNSTCFKTARPLPGLCLRAEHKRYVTSKGLTASVLLGSTNEFLATILTSTIACPA